MFKRILGLASVLGLTSALVLYDAALWASCHRSGDLSSGEHTLVSRVTDVTGKVQPTAEELEHQKTFLEDNSQYPRKVLIV